MVAFEGWELFVCSGKARARTINIGWIIFDFTPTLLAAMPALNLSCWALRKSCRLVATGTSSKPKYLERLATLSHRHGPLRALTTSRAISHSIPVYHLQTKQAMSRLQSCPTACVLDTITSWYDQEPRSGSNSSVSVTYPSNEMPARFIAARWTVFHRSTRATGFLHCLEVAKSNMRAGSLCEDHSLNKNLSSSSSANKYMRFN